MAFRIRPVFFSGFWTPPEISFNTQQGNYNKRNLLQALEKFNSTFETKNNFRLNISAASLSPNTLSARQFSPL